MEENKKTLLRKIKERKGIIIMSLILVFTIIFFILIISGAQDCEHIDIHEGVKKNCSCTGLTITVKTTASSGERKTICIGYITNRSKYK